jgi:predicted N-formylglutamate amidohydrolase
MPAGGQGSIAPNDDSHALPGGAAFLALRRRSVGPVLLTCEHASHRLPARQALDAGERAVLRSHWGWDIGAWALTRALSLRLGATAIGGRWSRLLVDLNRRADDPTLVREAVGGRRLSWNRGLASRELERRLSRFHLPYHAEVERLICRHLVRGIRPLLLSVHTFTPRLDGRRRPYDFGVLFDSDRRLALRLGRSLRRAGFRVRYNQPYSGLAGMMYSVDRHGSHHELPCLELEGNQDLFSRPSTARRAARAVAAALRELIHHEAE